MFKIIFFTAIGISLAACTTHSPPFPYFVPAPHHHHDH